MKDVVNRLKSPQWPVLLYLLIVVVSAILLWFKLGTLVPAWSSPEIQSRAAANSIHKIIGNPINAPYKLIQYGVLTLGKHGVFWMRLISTVFAGLIIVGFYQILRSWYSSRVALLCAFLFMTSAWFLHYARLATPDILLASGIALIWIGIRLKSNSSRTVTLILGGIITVAMVYVPGMIWVIGTLLFWQRSILKHDFTRLAVKWRVLIIGGLVVGLAPLLHGIIKHPSLIRGWAGLPAELTPRLFFSNMWHLPVWIVLQGPRMPVYWLGHVPFLDVFSVTMLALGGYVLYHYRALDRIKAMILILAVGAVLTILNGPMWLFFVAPVLYLTIAAGVALLLQQWFTVFPRNPLARTVGIALVTAVVGMASYYNLHHYFVAWPNDPVTKIVFSQHG